MTTHIDFSLKIEVNDWRRKQQSLMSLVNVKQEISRADGDSSLRRDHPDGP